VLLRNQRQFENHSSAQQQVILNYLQELLDDQQRQLEALDKKYRETSTRLANSFTTFKQKHTDLIEWQQEQVTALFRNQTLSRHENANGQPHFARREADELYAAFVSKFRGEPQSIKSDLRRYLSLLKESQITSAVLDLGCGRGEWLELLKENNIEARGVEDNSILAAEVRRKGFDVINGGAVEYMQRVSAESLQAITAFHLLEHLDFHEITQLLEQVKRALKPGGLLIVETPNPKNLVVGACNFYSDPTHRQPLFPETVEFLLNHFDFNRVTIEYLHPVSDSPFHSQVPGAKELDTWFFGPRDFAAIAWK
jgi:O-antigen chain-terminating methyltransferase